MLFNQLFIDNYKPMCAFFHAGVRDFICETCGKSFKRKNHLEVHRRTHTGETPLQWVQWNICHIHGNTCRFTRCFSQTCLYRCEICGYQCRQRASLNWHMRKHTSEAHFNYTCEHCGKRFEKLDSVKFHKLKSHPDKQPTWKTLTEKTLKRFIKDCGTKYLFSSNCILCTFTFVKIKSMVLTYNMLDRYLNRGENDMQKHRETSIKRIKTVCLLTV